MSKCILFGDAHIHRHKKSTERLFHCLNVLDWIFQTAIERNIKNIVCLGDLFHDREKIEIITYHETFKLLEKYMRNSDLKFYIVIGNHDMWYANKHDITSVTPLASIKGVTVIDKVDVIDIDGFPVGVFPYTNDPAAEIEKIPHTNDYNVLLGHAAVDGAVWNTMYQTFSEVVIEHDGEMVKMDAGIFKGWNQVFLGHYHGEQRLGPEGNIEYVGSPLQLSFGEAFEKKHIVIYDLKTHEKEYVENTFSPKHYVLRADEIKKYNIEGQFVKVVMDTGAADAIDVQNEIAKLNPASLDFKKIDKKDDDNLVEDAKAIIFNQSEMLEKWIEAVSVDTIQGLDKNYLLSLGKEICGMASAKVG